MTGKSITNWPHAPTHRLSERGAYMVTAGTYGKVHYLNTPERRETFTDALFALASEYGWQLQAWAVMSNHYHFVALSPEDPEHLREMLGRLHHDSSVALNAEDTMPNRRVWYQYWDKQLTYQGSYMARLKYVKENPVHHGVVHDAEQYRWCSAWWFREHAGNGFRRAVESFRIDAVKEYDEF